MRRRVRIGTLASATVLAGVMSAVLPVVAQDTLPGGAPPRRYGEGILATPKQPAPDLGAPDGVYGVGPWPTYTSTLADGPGRDLVIGACSICHSTTYISMQPPLPAAAWAATVDKMIQAFGANISDDMARQITQYLQNHYTPETRH
jgi:hypothetical protein